MVSTGVFDTLTRIPPKFLPSRDTLMVETPPPAIPVIRRPLTEVNAGFILTKRPSMRSSTMTVALMVDCGEGS